VLKRPVTDDKFGVRPNLTNRGKILDMLNHRRSSRIPMMTTGSGLKLTFGRKQLLLIIASIGTAIPVLYGQGNTPAVTKSPAESTTVKLPVFDVVSVRQNKSGTNAFRSRSTPDGISVENASLLMLIREAYAMMNSLDDRFLRVPDWAGKERYDIQAKVDPSDIAELPKLDATQRGLMLQALLADRFKLVTHREVKEQPVYALVIAKNGLKLTEAKPDDTNPDGAEEGHGNKRPNAIHMSRGHLAAQTISMRDLEVILTQITGRTVLDKTGLKGNYDVILNFAPVDGQPTLLNGVPQEETRPSIFTALQEQTGLKLESQKASVEVLVIDHVERPSEN
jgi:uncharacterized protein (TIGR03435 family)